MEKWAFAPSLYTCVEVSLPKASRDQGKGDFNAVFHLTGIMQFDETTNLSELLRAYLNMGLVAKRRVHVLIACSHRCLTAALAVNI